MGHGVSRRVSIAQAGLAHEIGETHLPEVPIRLDPGRS